MEHYVRLDHLPDAVDFPADLKSKIWYDAVKRRLGFRGFMCKADFDRLAALHDDLAYRRAIEQLFQVSTDVDVPQFRRIRLVLVFLEILCLALAVVVWWQLLRDPASSKGSTQPSLSKSSLMRFIGRRPCRI